MKGFKLGILMITVVGVVSFGGYSTMAMTQAPIDSNLAQRISELLAQIKWLQEELLKLQNDINKTVPIPTTKNLPPVITGLSGPTELKVGETGKFSVNAYDPEGKTLYYLIKWGDEPVNYALDYQTGALSYTPRSQQSTYTHSYAKSGNYTINVEVVDENGNTAKSSITVMVKDAVASVMKVVAPNGGEVLYTGINTTISWQGMSDYVNIYLVRDYNYDCGYNHYYPCAMPMTETETSFSTVMYYQPDILIFNYLPSMTNNSVNWVVGTGTTYDYYNWYPYMGDGNYKIKVCTVTTGVCDTSDSSFRIASTYYPHG